MRPRRTLLVVLLLLSSAALVAATHNHGHRLYIAGRVIDAAGLPVASAGVSGELESLEIELNEGPCRSNPCSTRTNERGDYGSQLYWHGHGIDDTGTAKITVLGETFSTDYDTDTRYTVLNAQLSQTVNHTNGTAETWERSYTVSGRLWVPDGGLPDGQTTWVEGTVPGCITRYGGGRRCVPTPVNVTLELSDGRVLNQTVRSLPSYGNFEAHFEADAPITGGTAIVEAHDQRWTAPLDTTYRSTHRIYAFPPPESAGLPIVPILGGVVVLGGAVGGYFGFQKLKAKRELEKARERSGRKRANE